MSKLSINRLWFQLSLAFGAVILIASIIVPIVFFLMRPDFVPREIPPDAGQRFVLLRIQGLLVFLAVGSVVGIIAGTWTAVMGSPPSTCPIFLTVSTVPITPVIVTAVALGWDWQSCALWSRRTTAMPR